MAISDSSLDQEKSIKRYGPIINGAFMKLKAGKHNNTAEIRAHHRGAR
jgi:hypothetical protein